MYEQGDIDWAAQSNHMDNMLGAILDLSVSVAELVAWIRAHGGWEKIALDVTARDRKNPEPRHAILAFFCQMWQISLNHVARRK